MKKTIKLTDKQIQFMLSLKDELARQMYYRGMCAYNGDEEAFLKKAEQILSYQKEKLAALKK